MIPEKFHTKLRISIVIPLVIVFFMPTFKALAANFDALQAYGVDTIAGYSSLLTTSKTYPHQAVVFEVKKPDGSLVKIPATTDAAGVAKVDLYDYHTRRSGTYSVVAYPSGSATKGSASYFTVYPDEVSAETSSVVAARTIAKADGVDKVYVTVGLRDQYSNPFRGHQVNLVSSRSSDNVFTSVPQSTTDINGALTFVVSSSDPGVSSYSAIDATTGVVPTSRAQVAYMSTQDYISDAGGSLDLFIPVAEAAESGAINNFEIADIPANIQPNQNVSFRVTARDSNNVTVENYTGTIHFSADGANSGNVTLPEDYAFKAEDLGTHEFSLGLKFTTAGTYKIVVTDVSNQIIKGEKTVTVAGGGSPQQPSAQKPTITSPMAGTYSQNVQTVSGTTAAGLTVKIFDNDQEIGSVQANSSGIYTFQTAPLVDGVHKVYVVSMSGGTVQGTSDTVEIVIDTTPPTVDEISITPTTGITPGSVINVQLITEENLSQAAVIFNEDIIELTSSPDQAGAYKGSIQAPSAPGVYPLDVLLVDQLSNEATYEDQVSVTVQPAGATPVTPPPQTQETQATQVVQEPQNLPPAQVFGLIAYGSDKRVTLVWEAANDDGTVKNYRISYGLDPSHLENVVNTKDASTTWYIPNLINGKEYFFAVKAVDDKGLESVNGSDVVSAIPFTLEVNSVPTPTTPLNTTPQEVILRGAAIESMVPAEMSQQGPELIWLLFGSGGFAGIARVVSRRKKIDLE